MIIVRNFFLLCDCISHGCQCFCTNNIPVTSVIDQDFYLQLNLFILIFCVTYAFVMILAEILCSMLEPYDEVLLYFIQS